MAPLVPQVALGPELDVLALVAPPRLALLDAPPELEPIWVELPPFADLLEEPLDCLEAPPVALEAPNELFPFDLPPLPLALLKATTPPVPADVCLVDTSPVVEEPPERKVEVLALAAVPPVLVLRAWLVLAPPPLPAGEFVPRLLLEQPASE